MKEIRTTDDKLVALMQSAVKTAQHSMSPEARVSVDKLFGKMENFEGALNSFKEALENFKETTVDIKYIRKDVDEITVKLLQSANHIEKKSEQYNAQYVSKEQFIPVQRIVYGLVTMILVSVFGALVALVLK